ncbi:hypoxanthine phosphoribosyltransferase isoform X3 [Macadamia integrifolia]|uniref:hypoxanthine phosphoribosyltransferase isoform X3 n=1 Tax=Macadamia integrifolia TaxID=60698 RepID=UPI001C4E2F24|nr:hypoxanthine phosphoribosyltransferase isoform X3 [Macadamia integrifolia]
MMSLEDHIERILWTEQQISERVSELASQISDYFKGSSSSIVVVGVATGAFLFLADIVRKIKLPVSVDLLRVESYGSGTESNGAPRISSDVKIDIKGKHVLLVEDIVDTGNTLTCVVSHLASKGASSVSVCSFLDKPARRKVHIELVGEGKFYRGFEVIYLGLGQNLDLSS